ncbi:MAG TPA: nickel-binding protein [Sphingomicrobium sp.]|nr:nickel-binding protein [Sphingomicrobium sp.]
MPLYMDIHVVPGATPEALQEAHNADLAVQHKHCVHCLKYWFNADAGKVFCLFDAPSPEAAAAVHREAHGLMAEKIIEVDSDMADGLLGPGEVNGAGAVLLAGEDGKRDSGVRSILFTDIVGSTEMTSRHGDEAAIAMLEVHDHIVRVAIGAQGGREVKHTGDGIMAAFNSAACAVKSASEIIGKLAEHNDGDPEFPVIVRIGISAGEPVEQHEDLFGSTVQLAARLCAQAAPGQILVSNVVADLCIGKNLKFSNAGDCELKGFDGRIPTRAVDFSPDLLF